MNRPEQRTTSLVAVLGLGLLALLYAVWVQQSRVEDNRAALRQQQTIVNDLLTKDVANTRELAELRTLVQALSDQVRSLGGTPVTLAPTPAATPQGSGPSGAAPSGQPQPAAGTRSPTPRSSPTPQPAPSPSRSVSPTPSPATRVCAGSVCVPTGGNP